jgi:hypothetical protein
MRPFSIVALLLLGFNAAAGGWVGITYSYEVDGFEVAGSQVPRRV